MKIELYNQKMLPDILYDGQWAVIQSAHINADIYPISFLPEGQIKSHIKSMTHHYTIDGNIVTAVLNDGRASYTGEFNPVSMTISGKAVTSNGKESWSFEFEKMSWTAPQTPPHEDAIFSVPKFNDQNEVWALRPYRSYRIAGSRNPSFDGYSSKVLDLKNKYARAIEYFYNRLNPIIFGNDIAICYVPSSDPTKTDTGIRQLAIKLATQEGRTDATTCLVRSKQIEKLATGGRRDIQVHLDSLMVDQAALIKDKIVLLLDDVTTSHNSLLAGRQLLLTAGAKKVYCLALAQT